MLRTDTNEHARKKDNPKTKPNKSPDAPEGPRIRY